jgi:predicted nicotinamide N-methyase
MMSNSTSPYNSDNDSGIFAVSEDLVAPAPMKSASVTTIDFDGLLSTPLKLHEDLKNGCGGMLWPAGMVLSKYLLRSHKESLAGKEM